MLKITIKKPVFVKAVLVLILTCTFFGLGTQYNTISAINEDPDFNNPKITGLWSTGRANDGSLLPMPARHLTYLGGEFTHDNTGTPDPHWELTGISNPPSGASHCQQGTIPRQAVTLRPPGSAWLPGPPRTAPDFDWVWWGDFVESPANGGNPGDPSAIPPIPAAPSSARWVGAEPNSFHNTQASCKDPADRPGGGEAGDWITWTYKMTDFYVGACVALESVELNFKWAADNGIELFLNPTMSGGVITGGTPIATGGGIASLSGISTNNLVAGPNTLAVRVRSSFPLTGFFIEFQEPTINCRQNNPYLRVGGGDVYSGVGMKSNAICAASDTSLANARNAAIKTSGYAYDIPDFGQILPVLYGSSSSEYAAYASGKIGSKNVNFIDGPNAFMGNNRYYRAGGYVRDLLFANATNPTTRLAANTDYGAFYANGNIPCIGIAPFKVPPSNTVSGAANLSTLIGAAYNSNPVIRVDTLNVSGNLAVPAGVRRTIIVNNNVTINGNITYPATGYTNSSSIPNITIISLNTAANTSPNNTGDIFINKAVTDIDANLIAWPDDNGSGGRLDTCADAIAGGSGVWPTLGSNLVVASCPNQVRINGLVMAKQVLWKRTGGTLGTFGAALADATCVMNDGSLAKLNQCAAEYINRNPASYISPLITGGSTDISNVPVSTIELPPVY